MTDFASKSFISKLKKRDRQAVSELVKAYNKNLFHTCLAHKLNPADAEDIVQSSWATFFTALDKFEGRSHIKTFLFGILFNKIKENYRHHQKRKQEDCYDDINELFDDDGFWNYQPIAPDKFVDALNQRQALDQCYQKLPSQQQSVLYLKEFSGDSNEAICETLNLSLNNLRVTLYRAKSHLRRCLERLFQKDAGNV